MSQSIADQVKAAIEAAIPESKAEVSGSGGHFEIRVVAAAFEGKSLLQKQRLVYKAMGSFMHGDNAPVHAVDKMETLLPEG
jgi:acid stress-induced BolA-like protein IbaG/YrbA